MSVETFKVTVNPKEYFSKMNPEDSAAIVQMCLEELTAKANELKDLYMKLAKSYGIEMGAFGITLLVQITSPNLPFVPTHCAFGTSEGIRHALASMMKDGIEDLANMNKEEKDDENIH